MENPVPICEWHNTPTDDPAGYKDCREVVTCVDVREAWSEGYAAARAKIVADLLEYAAEQRRLASEALSEDNGWLCDEHTGNADNAEEFATRYEARADVKETK